MLERINLIIKTKNLSASQFADRVGVQRSSVSHVLSGRNKPSLEFIQKVLKKFPDIRTEWLMFGNGSMSNTLDLFSIEDRAIANSNEKEYDKGSKRKNEAVTKTDHILKTDINTLTTSSEKLHKAKSLVKIVMFYNDNSFVEYTPE